MSGHHITELTGALAVNGSGISMIKFSDSIKLFGTHEPIMIVTLTGPVYGLQLPPGAEGMTRTVLAMENAATLIAQIYAAAEHVGHRAALQARIDQELCTARADAEIYE